NMAEIITHRGSSLNAEATQQMYHPLGMAITKLVTGELERWDEFLQQALFTLRRTTSRASFSSLSEKEFEEQRLQRNAQTFEELGHQRQRSKAQAVKMKDVHDNKHDSCNTNFAEGDWVKLIITVKVSWSKNRSFGTIPVPAPKNTFQIKVPGRELSVSKSFEDKTQSRELLLKVL
ncbi:hypothetical protein HK099_006006, partial [Clydaea vesicula]